MSLDFIVGIITGIPFGMLLHEWAEKYFKER